MPSRSMTFAPVESLLSAAAGAALGGVFGTLAKLRRGKPLHPHGVVYDAVVRRTGCPTWWDAPWLDSRGQNRGTVRLSRAVGLPGWLPDILGLALTFTDRHGDRHDLLLATTGLAPVGRFVLVPRRRARSASYTSLLPYRTPRGPVLLAAVPAPPRLRPAEASAFRLLAATPAGPWEEFATLELTGPAGAADAPLRLDPVLHALPGLRFPDVFALLREPAYAAARRTPVRAASSDPARTG
jgi:hypothetical protein